MGRYTGSVCRLCRREGIKLYLKGEKCFSPSCPLEKRPYPPGEHGRNVRPRPTDYWLRLREKQRARRIYGVSEKQFKKYYEMADRMKGVTGENLLILLERRLDNVIYRMGFAASRKQARQLVTHRHFKVNGRVVDKPSYLVKQGDVIEVKEQSKNIQVIKENLEKASERGFPHWVDVDPEAMKGKFVTLPAREDLRTPEIREQLIVEFYSR